MKKSDKIFIVIGAMGVLIAFLTLIVNFLSYEETNQVNIVNKNQQGGNYQIYVVDKINLEQKEELLERDPDGLYQNGKRVGRVINFITEDKTFTIDQIEFDQPLSNPDAIWLPFEYKDYLIQIQQIRQLVVLWPPGAEGIQGVILKN